MTVTILVGDALGRLKKLPSNEFHSCVTSPPYYGLRSYLSREHPDKEKEIGSEESPGEYVDKLVKIFQEVRRVLRNDGTCWVNIGDSYCRTDKWGGGRNGNSGKQTISDEGDVPSWAVRTKKAKMPGIKPKDLILIPARLAIALQEDGWWVRSDIIWHKINAMPESIKDRPSSAHEHVLLLSKSNKYFYNFDAVKEDALHGGKIVSIGAKSFSRGQSMGAGVVPSGNALAESYLVQTSRNLRNVWSIATKPSSEAHFAIMAPEIAERCIRAGTPAGGRVIDPFGGAGTTGLVADRMGRDATLIELNPEYATIAESRIFRDGPLFADTKICKGVTP